MNKQEFLEALRQKLAGLPQEDRDERLNFYSEMIDDRMEEGLSEEEAVADVGSVDDVVTQIISDTPLSKLVKEKVKPKRRLRVWEIVLIVAGAPIWLSLLLAGAVVAFSLYLTLWSLIAALWAVDFALAMSFLYGCVSAVVFAVRGYGFSALATLGAGLFSAGAAVFLFFGCVAAAKGVVRLTKRIVLGIKSLFIRKEGSK